MLALEESEFLPSGFFTICLNGILSYLTLWEERLNILFTFPTASSGCPSPCWGSRRAGLWKGFPERYRNLSSNLPVAGAPFCRLSWKAPIHNENVSPRFPKAWAISSLWEQQGSGLAQVWRLLSLESCSCRETWASHFTNTPCPSVSERTGIKYRVTKSNSTEVLGQ